MAGFRQFIGVFIRQSAECIPFFLADNGDVQLQLAFRCPLQKIQAQEGVQVLQRFAGDAAEQAFVIPVSGIQELYHVFPCVAGAAGGMIGAVRPAQDLVIRVVIKEPDRLGTGEKAEISAALAADVIQAVRTPVISWRRGENMGAWPWWPALVFAATAYAMAGSVVRYVLPVQPLFVPVAAYVLCRLREGRWRRQLRIFTIIFIILLIAALIISIKFKQGFFDPWLPEPPITE